MPKGRIAKVRCPKRTKTKSRKGGNNTGNNTGNNAEDEQKNDDFPYRDTFVNMSSEEILKTIRNYKPEVLTEEEVDEVNQKHRMSPFEDHAPGMKLFKFKGKRVVFYDRYEKHENMNKITDLFSERCRVQCKFYGSKISPHDYFIQNRLKLDLSRDKRYSRELIYRGVKECSLFNITVAMNLLKYFNVKKWLDFSAGWGDRLISAIAHDVDMYVGVDPSPCMNKVYPKIIEKLAEKPEKFQVIDSPFEDAKLPKVKFDFVFTSPPFFDLEVYNNDKKQSAARYNTFDSWMENFMLVAVKKAWGVLKKGGHMILYIPDRYKGGIIGPDVSKFIVDKLGGKALGKIYYYYEDRHTIKGIYVWKK